MKKTLCGFFAPAALLFGLAAACPQEALAGYGRIYIIGNDSDWTPYTQENRERFVDKALEETAPNVYEGSFTIDQNSSYIRFFSDFAPSDVNCWRSNCICPLAEVWFGESSVAGVYTTTTVYDEKLLPETVEPLVWHISPGDYHFIVDLNKKEITAIRQDVVLMVPSDDSRTPSLETAGEFANLSQATYMPAGDYSFSLYGLYDGKWLDFENGYDSTELTSRRLIVSEERPSENMTLTSWPGGVLQLNRPSPSFWRATVEQEVYVHKPVPASVEQLYIVGDCTGWLFDNAIAGQPLDDSGMRWSVEVPAGAQYFKFTGELSWDINYGVKATRRSADGGVTCYLAFNGDNMTFDTPLEAPMTITVDLENMVVELPAGVAMTPGSDVAEPEDVLYVLTKNDKIMPSDGMSQLVDSRFVKLYPDGKGNYSGEFMYTGPVTVVSSRDAGQGVGRIVPTVSDYVLTLSEGQAYTRAVNGNEPGYWRLPNSMAAGCLNTPVTMTVTPGEEPVVKFVFQKEVPATGSSLYLIGDPTGWYNTDDSYELKYTSKGYNYGEFYFTADQGQYDYDFNDNLLQFRFAKTLGTWDSYAFIGSDYPDFKIVSVKREHYGSIYDGGLSNWAITGWNGGWLYIAVHQGNGTIQISESPIPGVGEFVDPSDNRHFAEGVYLSYVLDNNTEPGMQTLRYESLEKISDGCYLGERAFTESEFRTRQLPIGPQEPEWSGSYTLSALNPDELVYDDFGVAEIPFENRNYVGTETPEPFRLGHDSFIREFLVDLNNDKAYFSRINRRIYIGGELTGFPQAGYADREKLRDISVYGGGGIYNMPAGNPRFILSQRISGINSTAFGKPLTLGLADSVGRAPDYISTIFEREIELQNWKGGDVFICNNAIYDLSQLSEIKVGNWALDFVSMTQDSNDKYVFTAQLPYSIEESQNVAVAFNMMIQGEELPLGNGQYFSGTQTDVQRPVTAGDNVRELWAGSWGSFSLPTVSGSGVIGVRLNLRTMTAEFDLSQTEHRDVYEVVSASSPELDGTSAVRSAVQEGAVTVDLQVTEASEGGYEFNLTTDGGSVIKPRAGQEEIRFGADGCWTGDFVVETPSRSSGRSARSVARAASTAKWHFSMPDNMFSGRVSLLVDEKAGKITAFSPDYNQGFFIVIGSGEGYEITPMIENISRMPRLTKHSDGKYYGSFEMPETVMEDYRSVRFGTDLYGNVGINLPFERYNGVADFNSANVVDFTAIGANELGVSYATQIILCGPADRIGVTYDPVEYVLTMDAINAGVDNVAEESGLTVRGSAGCLIVDCGKAQRLTVYNLQGMAVKTVELPAGESRIALPAGLYIAAGVKAIVK